MTHTIPKPGAPILLHQKSGAEPFEFNFNNEKPKINEVEAVVVSESKIGIIVELKQSDTVLQPFRCNIPKRFFTSKGSNLKANPPTISIPMGFNISPVDESEKEYVNPLDRTEETTEKQPIKKEQMKNEKSTSSAYFIAREENSAPEQQKSGLIFQKMIAVMREIEAIGKNQTADDNAFSFRGIDDIINALHPIFQLHGIFIAIDVLSHQTNAVGKTVVSAKFSFFAEDGSFVTSSATGESMDKSEHGTAKAISSAQKITLEKMFLIPSDDREFLTQPQVQKALLRINGNDKELLAKLKKEYRIKPEHLKMLEEAHLKKNKS